MTLPLTPNAIRSIRVNGFKSLQDATIDLHSRNLLIGANNAGKSNLVALFRLMGAIVTDGLQDYVARFGGADYFLYAGADVTPSTVFTISFANPPHEYHIELSADSAGALYFTIEQYVASDVEPVTVLVGRNHRESKLFEAGGGVGHHLLRVMRDWRVYHFHDTGIRSPLRNPNDSAIGSLNSNGSNLVSVIQNISLHHPTVYRRIVHQVRQVAPNFSDFHVASGRLQFYETGNSNPRSADYLSDGTLRFIAVTVALLQPNPPATILIDEVELGLHPQALIRLAAMIQSASAYSQIIAATQSSFLVSQFDVDDIITVDKVNGQSQFERLDVEQLSAWLAEFDGGSYSIGDLWEKSVIGGQP